MVFVCDKIDNLTWLEFAGVIALVAFLTYLAASAWHEYRAGKC